ncbi:hypothetical protein BIW11_11128, partial [Tropilaelaps mercedesae]
MRILPNTFPRHPAWPYALMRIHTFRRLRLSSRFRTPTPDQANAPERSASSSPALMCDDHLPPEHVDEAAADASQCELPLAEISNAPFGGSVPRPSEFRVSSGPRRAAFRTASGSRTITEAESNAAQVRERSERQLQVHLQQSTPSHYRSTRRPSGSRPSGRPSTGRQSPGKSARSGSGGGCRWEVVGGVAICPAPPGLSPQPPTTATIDPLANLLSSSGLSSTSATCAAPVAPSQSSDGAPGATSSNDTASAGGANGGGGAGGPPPTSTAAISGTLSPDSAAVAAGGGAHAAGTAGGAGAAISIQLSGSPGSVPGAGPGSGASPAGADAPRAAQAAPAGA